MSKLIVPSSKPRNPFVALARSRKAGSHTTTREKALEKAVKRAQRRGEE